MNTLSLTLGDLIDRTLFELVSPETLSFSSPTTGALSAVDTTLSLVDGSRVAASDILEIDAELMLVTDVTADAVPVITVSRGYYNSVAATHASGAVASMNPRHPRVRIAEAIRRSFARLEAMGLPLVETSTINREPGLRYAELPASTRDVIRVGYIDPTYGTWIPLDSWTFQDDVPTTVVSSGKLLRLPRYLADTDDLVVTVKVPYRWSTHPAAPSEASTITMIEGTEDLPMLYATSWLVSRREIGRTEIDRAEEWNQGEPSRGGVSAGTVRAMWQEFYRALDEARRLIPAMPYHRPFIPMPRITRRISY